MREGITFYRSWRNAVECLPPEEFKAAVLSILAYGLDGETPECDGIAKAILCMAKPTIDRATARAEAGQAGGKANRSKPKQTEANGKQTEANGKQTEAQKLNTDTDTETNYKKHIVPPTAGQCSDNAPYQEVVDYLNSICGTHYLATTGKTRELIRARHREGRTLDDFKKVIDRQARDWLNTEMAAYLRPETLFGTKFDGYLNAPEAKPRAKPQNQFNQFEQRRYNYDGLTAHLLKKQKEGRACSG